MDNQRLAAAFRGSDVGTETLALPVQFAFAAKVIQAGLADSNHLPVGREIHQFPDGRLMAVTGIGMHADGNRDVIAVLDQRQHGRIVLEIHRHAQHVPDIGRMGRGAHAFQPALEGLEIKHVEMAMGINQHKKAPVVAGAE